MFRWIINCCLLLILAINIPVQAQELEGFDLARIQRATVFIMQTRTVGTNVIITCVSTGTIISRDGLILTNAHSVVSNPDCPGNQLVIALTIRPDEPPITTYYAEVAQANEGLDLAILRITQDINGRFVDQSTISLPFVELADTVAVNLDETITVIGYPGLGDTDSVTSVRGTVTGFVAEPSGGDRSWIKTDATIQGTMRGGGAYNLNGQLIGIPTTVPIAPNTADVTCPIIQDTNNDGLINRADACVPLGSFINALRPIRFVRPLLRGASLDLTVTKVGQTAVLPPPTEAPRFSNLFFSPSVSNGMPTTAVSNLPTGATSLYLFFDYHNMTPDTIYELRVTVNDRPSSVFSLAPVRWSGGESGLWYIGSSGQIWPNGVYEFTLFINGIASGTQLINIGAQPGQAPPSFSNISFGILDPASGSLFGLNNVLPAGAIANARFIHRNMAEGTPWRACWYYKTIALMCDQTDQIWENDGSDTRTLSIRNQEEGLPLEPGPYRLSLFIDGYLSTLSEFTIAGAQEGAFPRVFTNTRFVSSTDPREIPTANPASTFSSGRNELYTVFDWEFLETGTLWTMRWSIDGTVFYEETVPWTNARTGQGYMTRLTAPGGLPDGRYKMEVIINNTILAETEATIGIGQLPIDPFASAEGVQLNGYIIDADTGEGIPSISLILISDEFSVREFTWNNNQVYTIATTDRNGYFQFERLLAYDTPYSIVIYAKGYLPMAADGVRVRTTDDTPNPLEIILPLTRDY
jgi:hypothetical protein